MSPDKDLFVDPCRLEAGANSTGIFVRAKHVSECGATEGEWGSHDIAQLTIASLLTWLRSRGGENRWAESVVMMLLGHTADDIAAAFVLEGVP